MTPDDIIYLDHAAATPCSVAVLRAMQPYLSDQFYNPSSPYAPAVAVRRDYSEAKQRIAVTFGGRGDEVIVTAGATESINMALSAAHDAHVVTSAIEHHAVLSTAKRYDHTLVEVNGRGMIDLDALAKAITPRTQVVSIALANNEIGTVQPLREIAGIIKIERIRRGESGDATPIWLHTDASQGVGQIDINVARLGVDMMTLNAGKCYGPKQVGLLWRKAGVELHPLLYGGGQEQGLRSGTENVAGTIGFAAALEHAERHRKAESKRLNDLRNRLEKTLRDKFPDMIISGNPKKRLPGSLHVAFPGLDAERLVFRLESRGVLVATGSACAANSGTRSHVLTAIGMSDAEADGSLRITLGALSDESSIERSGTILCEEISAEWARIGLR